VKLYHFTADRFLPGIKSDGLTKGVFPLDCKGKLFFINNCQWLTKNPEFIQPWHDPEFSTLPYDRRENRLTLNIPKTHMKKLFNWNDIENKFKPYFIQDFDFHDDKYNWHIFIGRIKPSWIREIEKRPAIPGLTLNQEAGT